MTCPATLTPDLFRGADVFAPRPDKHVGQADDPTNRRRSVNNGNRNCSWASASSLKLRTDDLRHSAGVFPILPDPGRPIVEYTLAGFGRPACNRHEQPGPDFLGGEDVPRNPVLDINVCPLPPVVPGRIPDRKATVGVCMYHQSGAPRSPRLSGPTLFPCRICALEALAVPRIGVSWKRSLAGLATSAGRAGYPEVRCGFRSRGHFRVSAHHATSSRKLLPSPLSPVMRFSRRCRSSTISGAGPTFSNSRRSSILSVLIQRNGHVSVFVPPPAWETRFAAAYGTDNHAGAPAKRSSPERGDPSGMHQSFFCLQFSAIILRGLPFTYARRDNRHSHYRHV